ncbi:MAG: alpha/beta fold hydrolase, partial [Pseudomonadota bacterium]
MSWRNILLIGFCLLLNYSLAVAQEISINKNLEKIKINGTEQWLEINTQDEKLPVLLILHGGPGFSMMNLFHDINPDLEKHYTVVDWDQRGAGRSYSANIYDYTMTLEQFIDDGHQVTLWLKKRFPTHPKIYLLGHSWGTMLGMMLVKKYPQDYFAYIGTGQVVDCIENEKESWRLAMAMAKKDNNERAILELETIGLPGDNLQYYNSTLMRWQLQEWNYPPSKREDEITSDWVEKFGGDLKGKKSISEINDKLKKYAVYKDIDIEAGRDYSYLLFFDREVTYFNLKKKGLYSSDSYFPKSLIPIYIFQGVSDGETPYSLAKEYFDSLEAPQKKWVSFEESAHFPFYEEPKKMLEELLKVKNETLK